MNHLVCDFCERVIRKEHQESVRLHATLPGLSPDVLSWNITCDFAFADLTITPPGKRQKPRPAHICGFCVRDALRTAELA